MQIIASKINFLERVIFNKLSSFLNATDNESVTNTTMRMTTEV